MDVNAMSKPKVWRYNATMPRSERPWIVSQPEREPTDHEAWEDAMADAISRTRREDP